jgi:carbonic anhydrase/acetyltransferase-like protein (isoleucine patch superfamily)
MIHKNVVTSFCREEYEPDVDPSAFVHPLAAVIGQVSIGAKVMVAPGASVRGDEGMPLHVGDESNVQDGVVIHGLVTERGGREVEGNCAEAGGKKFAVYVGCRVSLAHQCQIHGPAYVGDGCFIGMQSFLFRSRIGKGCVVEPKCLLMGVHVPEGRYVPAGSLVKEQKEADALPVIDDKYPLKELNSGVVRVNIELAEGYLKAGL